MPCLGGRSRLRGRKASPAELNGMMIARDSISGREGKNNPNMV